MTEKTKTRWIITFALSIGLFLVVYLAALAIGHNLAGGGARNAEAPTALGP
jgi:hypothetical protein